MRGVCCLSPIKHGLLIVKDDSQSFRPRNAHSIALECNFPCLIAFPGVQMLKEAQIQLESHLQTPATPVACTDR